MRTLLQAHDELARILGPAHPLVHLLSLNTALALESLGRPEDAALLVAQAAPVLRQAMGAGAPTFLRLQQLEQRLNEHSDKDKAGIPMHRPESLKSDSRQSPSINFFS